LYSSLNKNPKLPLIETYSLKKLDNKYDISKNKNFISVKNLEINSNSLDRVSIFSRVIFLNNIVKNINIGKQNK
jgi:hypothetical protein